MGFELTIILLVVISVIFALINKVMEARRRRELDEEDRGFSPAGRHGADPVSVASDAEFSVEDVFREPQPFGPPPGGEFREVRGTRRVSEADTGDEFQEVRGARPVSEAYDGDEFREVEVGRPELERPPHAETGRARVEHTPTEAATPVEPEQNGAGEVVPVALARRRRTRRRRIDLDFKPQTIRKAIIYQEILGPPVADRMR